MRRLLVLAGALALSLGVALPARASMDKSMTIDASHPKATAHYAGPTTSRSTAQSVTGGSWTYKECTTASNYCDVVPFNMHPAYHSSVLNVLVWWTGTSQTALDIRVFDPKDSAAALVILNPTNPPNEESVAQSGVVDDLPDGTYGLAVECKSSPCTQGGFSVELSVDYPAIYTPPSQPGPPAQGTSQPTQAAQPSAPAPVASGPTPDAALTPGTDGPDSSSSIHPIPVGKQASPPSNSMANTANIVGLVLLLGILGGGGLMVVRRIRADLHH